MYKINACGVKNAATIATYDQDQVILRATLRNT